jgi:O-antigen/teichoic acid export membrane protein
VRVIIPFLLNTLLNFVTGLLLARFLGPAQYGRFALTLATAMVLQTLCFDWLRLAAIRFYSERTRTHEPQVRATLDASFAVLIGILCCGAIAVLLLDIDLKLSKALVGLAVAASVANGLFDYHAALVRARFLDRAYARLIIVKNVLSLSLTVGGAVLFGSAEMSIAGVCLSMTGSLLISRRDLTDRNASAEVADRQLARTLLAYALPVVIANMLYQIIPLTDRAMAASQHGFAVSGQFSLAYDIGFRIASAVGSTMDILLFQIAVRAHDHHGPDRAKQTVARNIGLVLAVLAPAIAGCWIVLPSFEALVVPEEFRGPFAHYLTLLLPGLFCYAMIHWAINPIFQIGKRTRPLIAAALIASCANGLLLAILPAVTDASDYALAQSCALAVGLVALLVFALPLKPVWPRLGDIAKPLLATLGMVLALRPLQSLHPGLLTLLLQAGSGVLIYGVLALAVDIGGARSLLVSRWRTAAA